jgi:hypothetical protein
MVDGAESVRHGVCVTLLCFAAPIRRMPRLTLTPTLLQQSQSIARRARKEVLTAFSLDHALLATGFY